MLDDGFQNPSVVKDANIVMVDVLEGPAPDLVDFLERRSVRALAVGPRRVRLVVHRDLDEADVARCRSALREFRPTRTPS